MIEALERRLFVQAWTISVTLHGIAMTLGVLLVSQMKPLPLQDKFQWNVSLVEMLREQSAEPGTRAAGLRDLAPQAPGQPKLHVTATSQAVPSGKPNPNGTAKQQQLFEAPQVMEQPLVQAPPLAEVQQHQEAVAQVGATPVKETTRIEEAKQVETLSDARVQSILSSEPPSPVDASAPIRHLSPDVDKASPVEPTESVQMAAVPKEPGISKASPEPPQPVTGTARQAPAVRLDYGWLIESVSKRLAELKRYPVMARSNGLEGKVLLRAVVHADGQLAEVMVQKSSGYEELDTAAIETIREASPLHLRHELGRAQIVITIPLVYSLAR